MTFVGDGFYWRTSEDEAFGDNSDFEPFTEFTMTGQDKNEDIMEGSIDMAQIPIETTHNTYYAYVCNIIKLRDGARYKKWGGQT